MNPQFEEEFRKRQFAQERARNNLADFAKNLVPVLKDAGRPSTAAELESLVFMEAAAAQDVVEFVKSDPASFFALMVKATNK